MRRRDGASATLRGVGLRLTGPRRPVLEVAAGATLTPKTSQGGFERAGKSLKGLMSRDNLKEAFAGESSWSECWMA